MRAHYLAVKSRLLADSALATKGVFDTVRVDTTSGLPVQATYVVLFGGAADVLDDGRLSAPQLASSDAEYIYTVRAVSTSFDGVMATMTKVHAQLLGFIPTVDGRKCSAITLDNSSEVRPDNAVNPPMYYMDCDFILKSSRA